MDFHKNSNGKEVHFRLCRLCDKNFLIPKQVNPPIQNEESYSGKFKGLQPNLCYRMYKTWSEFLEHIVGFERGHGDAYKKAGGKENVVIKRF